MNTGIIASRYSLALLKLVGETGGGEKVVGQVRALQKALATMPDLRRAVDDSKAVTPDRKIDLLETALGEGMAPELKKFLKLLIRNGRIGDARLVFNCFVSDYDESQGIVRGRLVLPSADPDDFGDLAENVKKLIGERTGKELILSVEVDESIIGGFLLEVGDQLLDASVSHQLEIIRRQFEQRNRRIV